MKTSLLAAVAAAYLLGLCAPTLAQDASDAGRTLPDICKTAGMDGMQMDQAGKMDVGTMDQAHQDLMKGMDQMNANMMQGMQAKDIDVAFVCGMIPHHQGAIDMAKAELSHGDDPWAKQLAQKIVDDQEKEIAEMLDWLKKQSN